MDEVTESRPSPKVLRAAFGRLFDTLTQFRADEELPRQVASLQTAPRDTKLSERCANVLHRVEAVPWHVDLLGSIYAFYADQIHEEGGLDRPPRPEHDLARSFMTLGRDGGLACLFAFEDLVLNVVALFDYLALLCFHLHPEARIGGEHWSELANVEALKLLPAEVAAEVNAIQVWLKPLAWFRGDVAHKRAAEGRSAPGLDFDNLSPFFDMWVPVGKALAPLLESGMRTNVDDGRQDVDILDVAPALALRALSSATALVEAIANVRRPVPPSGP